MAKAQPDLIGRVPIWSSNVEVRRSSTRKGPVHSGDSGGLPDPSTRTKTNLQVERSAGIARVTVLLGWVQGRALISMECWKSSKKV